MKAKMKTTTKLWIGIGALAILCPVGLALPEMFKAGSAWGEWGTDEIGSIAGFVPKGLEKLSSLWTAALPDYAFAGSENAGLGVLSAQYIFSAFIGIAICVAAALLLGKILAKKKN
jgi:cobalt/nickel transport protein